LPASAAADKHARMNVAVVSGTRRPGNFTVRASRALADHIEALGLSVDFVDGRDITLNFPDEGETEDAKALQAKLNAADAVVLATPEYHGSFSAFVKLIIENMGFPSPLKSKPLALLGVASGRIGAIKSLEMLRSVCAHTGAFVLPGALSIAGVNKVFDEDGKCTDPEVDKQLAKTAQALADYLSDLTCPEHELEADVRESDPKTESWSAQL
jgi:NAD(P)H-dependent FMN reductase